MADKTIIHFEFELIYFNKCYYITRVQRGKKIVQAIIYNQKHFLMLIKVMNLTCQSCTHTHTTASAHTLYELSMKI